MRNTRRGHAPQFKRWDVCEAWYVFASLYHNGQFSDTYRALGRLSNLGFRPCASLNVASLSDNGREIFGRLVRAERARTRRAKAHEAKGRALNLARLNAYETRLREDRARMIGRAA